MKKVLFITAIVVTLVFSGCSESDPASMLVGNWRHWAGVEELRFYNDRSWRLYVMSFSAEDEVYESTHESLTSHSYKNEGISADWAGYYYGPFYEATSSELHLYDFGYSYLRTSMTIVDSNTIRLWTGSMWTTYYRR